MGEKPTVLVLESVPSKEILAAQVRCCHVFVTFHHTLRRTNIQTHVHKHTDITIHTLMYIQTNVRTNMQTKM